MPTTNGEAIMIRSASEILRDLEIRVARLEGRTSPAPRTAAAAPTLEQLFVSGLSKRGSELYIDVSHNRTGSIVFRVFLGSNDIPEWDNASRLIAERVGEDLKMRLRAPSIDAAWAAIFRAAKVGDDLSDRTLMRKAQSFL